jgi:pyruvate formate lyase activating enzyme
MQNTSATPIDTLIRARKIAQDAGMHYVYTGNVHNEEGDSTWCHHCGNKLIGRDWYVITEWHLDEKGQCHHCGKALPGLFEARPGNWGARRLPVRLRDFAA